MTQHSFLQQLLNVLALIFIGMTVACSSLQDDVDELKSEINILKETVAGLEKAQAESKVIKEVKALTDAAGWNLLFTDVAPTSV